LGAKKSWKAWSERRFSHFYCEKASESAKSEERAFSMDAELKEYEMIFVDISQVVVTQPGINSYQTTFVCSFLHGVSE